MIYGYLGDRMRMDLLYRLRWNLMADLHDVQIVLGPENEETTVPLFDHSAAHTDLGVPRPGFSRIEVASRECGDKFDLSYDSWPEEDVHRPPPSLIIENEGGKSITLGQFVTEVHAYLNEHMEEVKKAVSVMGTTPLSEMKLFYRRAWPNRTDDGNIIVHVEMMPQARHAEYWEILWAQQLRVARTYEYKHFSAICGATSGGRYAEGSHI